MIRSRTLLIASALLVSGCQQYQLALSASGPTQDRTDAASPINTFRAAFTIASRTAPSLDVNDNSVEAVTTGRDAIRANAVYLNTGFALADSNCLDYFRRAGKLQQAANVFKDISIAFVPIASGALALSANSAKAGAILALVGASSTTALNTVFTDFLFDASNIDDVQQLTTAALATHETKVRENIEKPGTAINFSWTTQQIMEHQAICQPAHVLFLVRQAIANGRLIAQNAGSSETPLAAIPLDDDGPVPPPPSRVEVKVVPREAAAPAAASIIIQASPDARTTSLARCIWPDEVRFDPERGAVTASGTPAHPDRTVVSGIQAWIAQRKLPSLAVLLLSPTLAAERSEAVARFCKR